MKKAGAFQRNADTHSHRTPMDAALYYLEFQPRTIREVERYLDQKQYGEYEIYQVIERLKELNYLNDTSYAEEFIQTRLASKPISRRKLKEQLYQHEIDSAVIDEALSQVTDEMEQQHACLVAQKFFRQFSTLPVQEQIQRVTQRLVTRGFDYATIRVALEQMNRDYEMLSDME